MTHGIGNWGFLESAQSDWRGLAECAENKDAEEEKSQTESGSSFLAVSL
jgi:hypothetical protein